VLTVDGGLLTGGAVAGGAAGPGAQDGGAHGSGIFLQGSETITLAAASGQTLTINDEIADQTGSGGQGATAGTGAIAIAGTGTVKLAAADAFHGGIRIESGTLDLAAGGAAGSGAISFASQPAVLTFAAADARVVAVNDFVAGDTIEVTGFVATGHSYAGGDLTLDGVGGPVVLDLPGLTGTNLSVTAGSTATAVLSGAVPCFCAGTKLRTETGEVAVERLAIGARVATLSGEVRPIIWIGHRRVDCRRHPNPEQVLPVRVARHAFGADRPRTDLLLSPDHAVLVEAVLIPIKCLINGRSIAQVSVDAVPITMSSCRSMMCCGRTDCRRNPIWTAATAAISATAAR
jgi:autotransporter-associated beta strand protein